CITSKATQIRSSWAKAPADRARPLSADRRSRRPPRGFQPKGRRSRPISPTPKPPPPTSPTAGSPAPQPTRPLPPTHHRKTHRTLTIKDVAKEAMEPNKLPKDMDVGLIATATYFPPVQNFPNGCHICELEVDQETGEVEIVRYSVVDDVGTVINPLLLKG